MKSKGLNQHVLPSRPPLILVILAVLFLLTPVLIHPNVLIRLGPLRRSLTSANDLVRRTTLIELNVLRVLLLMMFASVTAVLVFWKKLIKSKFVESVMEYKTFEYEKQRNEIINFSFIMTMVTSCLALIYFGYKNQLFSQSTIEFIIGEDGFVEWSTAIIFLICSFVSISISLKEPTRPGKIIHILFAIFFFVCFGEEISWGQRIFHFGTSELIKEINVQGETNLHNLSGYFADHLFIAGAFFYGVIIPVMSWIYPFWNRFFGKFGLPIASPGLAIGFLLISLIHNWTIFRIFPQAGYGVDEVRELLTSIAFLMLIRESASFIAMHKKNIKPQS